MERSGVVRADQARIWNPMDDSMIHTDRDAVFAEVLHDLSLFAPSCGLNL